MRSDLARRSFTGVVALGIGPIGMTGVALCGAMAAPELAGLLALDGRLAEWATFSFAAVTVAGVTRGAWSVAQQQSASRALATMVSMRQRPLESRVAEAARAQGLCEALVIDDHRAYAYTMGARNPRVVLSTALVEASSDAELAAILAHEGYHVAHRDPSRILVARAITAAMFFVPATPRLLERYRVARELEADRSAIRRCGRSALAGALMAAMSPAESGLAPVAGLSGAEVIDARLCQLERGYSPEPPALPWHVTIRSVVAILALSLALLAALAAAGVPILSLALMGDGLMGDGLMGDGLMGDGMVRAAPLVVCAVALAVAASWLCMVRTALAPRDGDAHGSTTISV